MPTAKQIIETIESEGLVPVAVLDSLHAEFKSSGGAITAEALTKRLVSFGAITQQQADQLLLSSGDSFRMQSAPAKPPAVKPTQGSPFEDELPDAPGQPPPGTKRRKHVKQTSPTGFDSPLILLGGGGLALLVLFGGVVTFLLNQQSGDDLLDSADKAYQSRSYSQAITDYESFVEDFPNHEGWSRSRVQLLVSRLRQAIDTAKDHSGALRIAAQGVPEVEDEPAFQQTAGGELASMLPRVAVSLAEQADEASLSGDGAKADELVKQVNDALALIGNTKYVPRSLRDDGEIRTVQELIDRVERRRSAFKELEQTLATMQSATGSGDITAAYAAHSGLIAARPELRADSRLEEALGAAADAERAAIRLSDERVPADTAERPTPLAGSIAVANRRVEGKTGAPGVFTAEHGGVVYAVAADDGRLLWRRPIGYSTRRIDPVPVAGDLLMMDHRSHELIRVDAQSGELRWRAQLGGAAAQPTVVETRLFVATESGRLLMIDAINGELLGAIDFAQRLGTPPVAGPSGRRLHVVGEHSSIYTLDLTTLECVDVYYLGHAPGAIEAPPVVAGGRLLVIDNVGVETAILRSLALDGAGQIVEQNADFRLDGVTSDRPVVAGRRVLVGVDTGQVVLFEVNAGPNQTAMLQVAERPSARRGRGPRFVAESAGEVWIAETGLMRSTPSLSNGRLVARQTAEAFSGDRFVAPLAKRGSVLLHARTRGGRGGLTIAATDTKTGAAVWQTDVATPPLGPPAIARRPSGISMTTSEGVLHRLGRAELRRGAVDLPAAAPKIEKRFGYDVTIAGGARVLAGESESDFVVARIDNQPDVRSGRLPGRLACCPAPFGDGWLAPLELGQVLLLDSRGREIATAFQPEAPLGRAVRWHAPGVRRSGGEPIAVLADDSDMVYCLALEGGALALRSSHRLVGSQPTTGAAATGSHAALGVTGGRLAVFGCPDLGAPRTVELPSAIAWGPHAVGERFLLATDSGDLIAVDPTTPSVVWRVTLDGRRLVGDPLVAGEDLVVVSDSGQVDRLSAATGELVRRIDLGQPLATGATAYGNRLLVGASDSAVLVVNAP